jgi:hypothetical protein
MVAPSTEDRITSASSQIFGRFGRSTVRRSALLFVVFLASAGPASAWEPETHVSIVRTAFLLSPGAEARVPGYLDELLKMAKEADTVDELCRYHSVGSRSDPVVQVDKIYAQLVSGVGLEKPAARARALGRFAHFVADCAVPRSIAAEDSQIPPDFFTIDGFVVFREKTPLTAPLGQALRKYAADLRSWNDSQSANVAAYRTAVSLVIEAFRLLPPAPGNADPADRDLILVALNKQDDGYGPQKPVSHWQLADGSRSDHYISFIPQPKSYETSKLTPFHQRRGVQIAEWASKLSPDESTKTVRALLINNDPLCAVELNFRAQDWTHTFPDPTMPPFSVRTVEFDMPATIPANGVALGGKSSKCTAAADGISGRYRALSSRFGSGPIIDERVRVIDSETNQAATPSALAAASSASSPAAPKPAAAPPKAPAAAAKPAQKTSS